MFKELIAVAMVVCVSVVLCVANDESSREPTPPDAKDLFTITVKGTTIDFLPNHVDVMAVSPKAEAGKLIAAGGKKNEGIPDTVFHRGVLFIFGTPESWHKTTDYQFQHGDVVYTYLLDSIKEKDEFQARYKLAKVTDLKSKGGASSPLYRASPRYYVLVQMRVTGFTCAMHPKVMKREAGKCPICAMELVPIEAYN